MNRSLLFVALLASTQAVYINSYIYANGDCTGKVISATRDALGCRALSSTTSQKLDYTGGVFTVSNYNNKDCSGTASSSSNPSLNTCSSSTKAVAEDNLSPIPGVNDSVAVRYSGAGCTGTLYKATVTYGSGCVNLATCTDLGDAAGGASTKFLCGNVFTGSSSKTIASVSLLAIILLILS